MSRPIRVLLLACAAVLVSAGLAPAGMPAPLPTEPQERILRLNDSAEIRLQAISFFLAALLLSAAGIRWLWNSLQRDFPRLPRLSYRRALAVVLLWGMLFVIVLTMISGARELMTPGAWQKQGFTYKLTNGAGPTVTEADPLTARRQHLERLRTALWQFAALHNGRFPRGDEAGELPADLWAVPGSGGLRYQYVPGLSASQRPALLASEPELDPERRLVLLTDGEIATLRSAEVLALRAKETSP